MQEGDALHAFSPLAFRLGGAVGRTRFLPVGLVAVFVRPTGGWKGDLTPTAELTIPPGLVDNLLGTSVAISSDGKTIVAGGPGEGQASGAYVFVEPEGAGLT